MPGFGGQTEIVFELQTRATSFLACVSYYDEVGKKYDQSFLFQIRGAVNSSFNELDEVASFGSGLCTRK